MKTRKLFWLAAVLFALALPLASCGGDDNGDGDEIPGNVTTGWSENGDTMTYTATVSYGPYQSTAVWTFKFTGDTCSGATLKAKYPTAAIAREVWDDMSDEEKVGASVSGDTITTNSSEFEGFSKDEIRAMISSIYA